MATVQQPCLNESAPIPISIKVSNISNINGCEFTKQIYVLHWNFHY